MDRGQLAIRVWAYGVAALGALFDVWKREQNAIGGGDIAHSFPEVDTKGSLRRLANIFRGYGGLMPGQILRAMSVRGLEEGVGRTADEKKRGGFVPLNYHLPLRVVNNTIQWPATGLNEVRLNWDGLFEGQEGLDDETLTALVNRSESEGIEAPLTAIVRVTVRRESGDKE